MRNKLLFPIDDGDELEAETPSVKKSKSKPKANSRSASKAKAGARRARTKQPEASAKAATVPSSDASDVAKSNATELAKVDTPTKVADASQPTGKSESGTSSTSRPKSKPQKAAPTRSQRLLGEQQADSSPVETIGADSTPPQSVRTREVAGPSPSDPSASSSELAELPLVDNLLIRASAGTGKTYQLTSRYLRLLLLGAPAESILATTFTRKAAGEILDRIVKWLGEAAIKEEALRDLAQAVDLPNVTQEECRDKLSLLTRQMHRLRIYTIDAFFMQMAMSFSLELGMTPGWDVLEEGGPESNRLRNEAIAGVLRSESLEDLLVLVHQLSPKGENKRSLDKMLTDRVGDAYRLFLDSTPDAWDRLKVPAPLSDDELAEVREELNAFSDRRSTIMKAKDADVSRIVNEDWGGFFNSGRSLANRINEGGEKYGNAKLPPELIELYQRFLPHLRSMILHSASAQTKGTHKFLSHYHEQYRTIKENQRLYSFDEVTDLLARQASDPDQFSFRMDAGIDHLLLDEFQDTSLPQWRAFESLAQRCTANEPGRSFFCVGDVKQAIYGWRGGSSEIFDLLDQKLPNLTLSELKDSRRSSPIIIDVVNEVFEFLPKWDVDKKLGRAERAAKHWPFPHHTTHCRDLPGYFTIETSPPATGGKAASEEVVFRRAAERVQTIANQAKGKTIGILCRTNGKVSRMMNELQRLGVPASEEGGNFLTDSAAVELVLSLLQLTDHPADSIAAFHLASSPWGPELDLRVGECLELPRDENESVGEDAVEKGSADVAESGETGKDDEKKGPYRPRAGIAPRKINSLIRRVRRQLLNEGFGNTLQGWAAQLRKHCNRREARRLTQLVEQAYAYQHRVETPTQLGYERQRRQSIRPTEFVRHIRETKVTDPSGADIRVMTVHQAKGLEFDVVVLPDLLGPFVEGHDTFLHRRPQIDADIDLVCRYMGKDSGRSFLPDSYHPLFDEFEDRRARDSFCVLYVAMTRAVHALHVFIPENMQMGGAKGHAGYLIKDTFAPGERLQPNTTIYEKGDKEWFMNIPGEQAPSTEEKVTEAPQPQLARGSSQARHLETVAPSQIGANRYVSLGERANGKDSAAKDFGTVVHLWLAQVEWRSGSAKSELDDAELRRLAEPWANSVEIGKTLRRFKKMLVEEPLSEILNHDVYLRDLRKSMPGLPEQIELEVRLEQPVAGRDDNQIVTGKIDRLVLVRSAGKIIAAEIIDYKTDIDGDANAVEKKTERYETQMAAYRRVIASSLRIDHVSTRLLFL